MGKSRTPRYVVEADGLNTTFPAIWRGRPTVKRLEHWRKTMNASFQPGGVNAHIADTHGNVPYVYRARICENVPTRPRPVVCEVKAPTFEIVG